MAAIKPTASPKVVMVPWFVTNSNANGLFKTSSNKIRSLKIEHLILVGVLAQGGIEINDNAAAHTRLAEPLPIAVRRQPTSTWPDQNQRTGEPCS
jgi:hypothetical protein